MRWKWILPVVLCSLLLVFWFFRWEHGPTQTENNLKILHLKDRWTGQPWVSVYGKSNGKFYSGEMKPIPSPESIAVTKTKILNKPEISKQKQDLENEITRLKEEISKNEAGHKEYVYLIIAKVERDTDASDWRSHLVFFKDSKVSDAISTGKYNSEIPEAIIENHRFWSYANDGLGKINTQLYTLDYNAEKQAESELKTWAWQAGKIATIIWAILFLSLLLITGRKIWRNNVVVKKY
ncbi:MAG: hypothetical protein PHS52_03275 [Desulfotomaculaceae bacterium]|nr:hypothetical protein [Desulfotomaculaceae bacterium]